MTDPSPSPRRRMILVGIGACVVAGGAYAVLRQPAGPNLPDAPALPDATAWSQTLHIPHERVFSIALSPDGTRLAGGFDDGTIRLWELATGEEIAVTQGVHVDRIWTLAFSPNGERLVSGDDDGEIRFWDGQTGTLLEPRATLPIGGSWSLAYSPDSTRILSGGSDTFLLLDATSGAVVMEPVEGHSVWHSTVAFTPDGTRLMAVGRERGGGNRDTSVRLWDAATGELIGGPMREPGGNVTSAAFAPDGQVLALGYRDGTVQFWDVTSGEAMDAPVAGHAERTSDIAYSPDGLLLASTGGEGSVRLWDAVNQTDLGLLHDPEDEWVNSVIFAPTANSIIAAGEAGVFVWTVN